MKSALAACAGAIVAAMVLTAQPAAAQAQVGAEVDRDRVTYHFDNPSSIDTPDLVPHFFEQAYVLDNVWLTGSVAYRAGLEWVTVGGVTPVQTHNATDYDTFFDPDGSVWVAGTTGDARVHSWRVAQRFALGHAGPVAFTGGYALQVDFADFLEGDRTVTRDGVLVSRSTVTSREYTNGQRHDVFVGARLTHQVGSWQLRVTGAAAPASISRLAIQLPDKYPGETLVYHTTSLWATGGGEFVGNAGRLPVAIGVDGGATLHYHANQWVTRRTLAFHVTIGR